MQGSNHKWQTEDTGREVKNSNSGSNSSKKISVVFLLSLHFSFFSFWCHHTASSHLTWVFLSFYSPFNLKSLFCDGVAIRLTFPRLWVPGTYFIHSLHNDVMLAVSIYYKASPAGLFLLLLSNMSQPPGTGTDMRWSLLSTTKCMKKKE